MLLIFLRSRITDHCHCFSALFHLLAKYQSFSHSRFFYWSSSIRLARPSTLLFTCSFRRALLLPLPPSFSWFLMSSLALPISHSLSGSLILTLLLSFSLWLSYSLFGFSAAFLSFAHAHSLFITFFSSFTGSLSFSFCLPFILYWFTTYSMLLHYLSYVLWISISYLCVIESFYVS